jgi:integrase/recombinase XerD
MRNNFLSSDELKIVKRSTKANKLSVKDALKSFIDDCLSRNLRSFTIAYYKREITAFFKQIKIDNVYEVKQEHIKQAIRDMRKTHKVTSINDRLRAIRTFFNFLVDSKQIKNNPFSGIKLLKDRQKVIKPFTDRQLNLLFRQPDLRTFTGVRDYTFMMVFLDTGIRLNELYNLDVDDIDLINKKLHVRAAKGYRERLIPMSDRLVKQLKIWLRIRGESLEEQALFINLKGQRISRHQIQMCIKKYGELAGINNQVRVSPHTFRHTFARLCVIRGAGVFDLMDLMGHSTMEMAKVYVNYFSTDLDNRKRQFSPLKSLEERKFDQ